LRNRTAPPLKQPFVGFALSLLRRRRLADERREFTLSVIGLLVTL
jgi:hypothetical protein